MRHPLPCCAPPPPSTTTHLAAEALDRLLLLFWSRGGRETRRGEGRGGKQQQQHIKLRAHTQNAASIPPPSNYLLTCLPLEREPPFLLLVQKKRGRAAETRTSLCVFFCCGNGVGRSIGLPKVMTRKTESPRGFRSSPFARSGDCDFKDFPVFARVGRIRRCS